MRILAAVVIALFLFAGSAAANSICRQALAMGLDVSGSVDADEYRLQRDGLAAALGDAAVVDAILADGGSHVRIAVYEWSTPGSERLILPWTVINDRESLTAIQTILRGTQRATLQPSTGIGHALEVGFDLLAQQPDCWKQTLDLSGDGKNNAGPLPQDVIFTPTGVTVNGLVIGSDDVQTGDERQVHVGELAAYYNAFVIRGPDAFVETAIGFTDYRDAMRRKLLRELAVLAIGQLWPPRN